MPKKSQKSQKSPSQHYHGFTIVELLIVIVVIAILAAITLVSYNGIQDRAYKTRYYATLVQIRRELETQYTLNGKWPFEDDVRAKLAECGGYCEVGGNAAERVVDRYISDKITAAGLGKANGTWNSITSNNDAGVKREVSTMPYINDQGDLSWVYEGFTGRDPSVIGGAPDDNDMGLPDEVYVTGSASPTVSQSSNSRNMGNIVKTYH